MNKLILKVKQGIISNVWAILLFGLASLVILWQMLLPGYVITLDMVFAPTYRILIEPGAFINALPIQLVIYIFSLVMPVWLIQKFILFGLFFALGYLAYRFLPVPKNYGAHYWVGIFYVSNPFVYERFLAGQWMILFAYALLPVIIYLLNKFYNNLNIKTTLGLVAGYLLLGIFSLHFLLIGLFVGAVYFIFNVNKSNYQKIIKQLLISLVLLVVLSGYWLVPYLVNSQNSNLSLFNRLDNQAFITATDPVIGTSLNVLSMYGFWGEGQPWLSYFIWPKANLVIWLGLFTLLSILIIFGFSKVFKQNKKQSLMFAILALIGFIFSVGVGSSIFKPINQFLFDHLWFWSGFRDTQKWSGLLILIYAIFGAWGVDAILKKAAAKFGNAQNTKFKIIALIIFFIPIFYTYTLWGGFSRQLKPVWYPVSWHEVKSVLDEDTSDYNVLFMPFHQYLSLSFNQQIVSQTPAKDFFGPKIVQGEKAEIGGITSQQVNTLSAQIDQVLRNKAENGQIELIRALRELNIKYIIYLSGYEEVNDPFGFDFEESAYLDQILETGDLTFYRIML